jgi:hypothetical protein
LETLEKANGQSNKPMAKPQKLNGQKVGEFKNKFFIYFYFYFFLQMAPYVLADVELNCAEGWEKFEGKCLKALPIERSWPQALAFCSRSINYKLLHNGY